MQHMIGLFSNIPATTENMKAIAEFNKIIKNYLKIKKLHEIANRASS